MLEHEPSVVDAGPGREGLKESIRRLRAAIPDLRVEVQDEIATGDRVVARIELRGTLKRPLGPFPATGREVRLPGIDIARFRNGKVVEHWGVTDAASLMEPSPAGPRDAGTRRP